MIDRQCATGSSEEGAEKRTPAVTHGRMGSDDRPLGFSLISHSKSATVILKDRIGAEWRFPSSYFWDTPRLWVMSRSNISSSPLGMNDLDDMHGSNLNFGEQEVLLIGPQQETKKPSRDCCSSAGRQSIRDSLMRSTNSFKDRKNLLIERLFTTNN